MNSKVSYSTTYLSFSIVISLMRENGMSGGTVPVGVKVMVGDVVGVKVAVGGASVAVLVGVLVGASVLRRIT